MKGIKISLAGDLGSGKSTVGKILAEKLGAEVYSTGTIQRAIALKMGMTTLQLNQYMETHPEIDGMIDDGLRALEHEDKKLIIDSRMAWHFVPSSFSVYMAADPYISAERSDAILCSIPRDCIAHENAFISSTSTYMLLRHLSASSFALISFTMRPFSMNP